MPRGLADQVDTNFTRGAPTKFRRAKKSKIRRDFFWCWPLKFLDTLQLPQTYFKSYPGRRAASCWALPHISSLYLGHDLDLSRSSDVIGHVTNRSTICHFLLVSHCNLTSISNRFRDIRPPIHVRAHSHTHTDTRRKWFYILSHAMYCIGQTISRSLLRKRKNSTLLSNCFSVY